MHYGISQMVSNSTNPQSSTVLPVVIIWKSEIAANCEWSVTVRIYNCTESSLTLWQNVLLTTVSWADLSQTAHDWSDVTDKFNATVGERINYLQFASISSTQIWILTACSVLYIGSLLCALLAVLTFRHRPELHCEYRVKHVSGTGTHRLNFTSSLCAQLQAFPDQHISEGSAAKEI